MPASVLRQTQATALPDLTSQLAQLCFCLIDGDTGVLFRVAALY